MNLLGVWVGLVGLVSRRLGFVKKEIQEILRDNMELVDGREDMTVVAG